MKNYLIKEIDNNNIDSLKICVDIIKKSFETVRKDLKLTRENCPTHPSFIDLDRFIKIINKGAIVFGLYIGSEQIGLYMIEKLANGYSYLEKLSILPEYRCQGYAKELIEHVIEYTRNNNLLGIKIDIVDNNSSLKKWYKKFGFVEVGKKKFKHLPFTVCFMEMKI